MSSRMLASLPPDHRDVSGYNQVRLTIVIVFFAGGVISRRVRLPQSADAALQLFYLDSQGLLFLS